MLELVGFEQTADSDAAGSGKEGAEVKRTFLRQSIALQGPNGPPSDSVNPSVMPENGWWEANKGSTVYHFSFDLPKQLPSSWSDSKKGKVTYELRALGQLKVKGVKQNLRLTEPITVHEAWSIPQDMTPVTDATKRTLRFGGKGELDLTWFTSLSLDYLVSH